MIPKSYYQQHNRPRVHRQVWEAVNGPIPKGWHVDHINGDIHDNRLENLRACKARDNLANSKRSKANKTGLKGLSVCGATGKWRGAIKAHSVGQKSFKSWDLLEVCCWIFRTRKELHGEYARFN